MCIFCYFLLFLSFQYKEQLSFSFKKLFSFLFFKIPFFLMCPFFICFGFVLSSCFPLFSCCSVDASLCIAFLILSTIVYFTPLPLFPLYCSYLSFLFIFIYFLCSLSLPFSFHSLFTFSLTSLFLSYVFLYTFPFHSYNHLFTVKALKALKMCVMTSQYLSHPVSFPSLLDRSTAQC